MLLIYYYHHTQYVQNTRTMNHILRKHVATIK